MDGHADLPSIVPESWATPELQMNHRSQRRIVTLINKIWETELEGRTQPTKGSAQHPRTEKAGGMVRFFLGIHHEVQKIKCLVNAGALSECLKLVV